MPPRIANGADESAPRTSSTSTRGTLGGDAPEQERQPLHHILALTHCRLDHTGERLERPRARVGLRALRHLALDHREPEPALGIVVRRLDPWIRQEPQQIAAGMMSAEFVEQTLVVRAHRPTRSQMPCHRLLE